MTRRRLIALVAAAALAAAAAAWLVLPYLSGGGPLAAVMSDPWTTSASVSSAVLGRDMPVEVFTPQDATPTALLVLFHGRGGNASQWMAGILGNGVGIDTTAHQLIDAHEIRPITIVSVSIDDSYGVDSAPATDGYAHGPYGTFIQNELMPAVISRWGQGLPTYVGGLSMGGYVALRLALSEPGRFAGVAALSPAFWVTPPSDREWMYTGAGGDPIALAQDGAADSIPMFLGYGKSDYDWVQKATDALSATLASRGRQVEPVIVPGGHEVSTWRALTQPMLERLFSD